MRGIEIEADGFFKGTRVDGVYTADPEKDPTATKFDEISFDEIYARNLKIMDMTAFTLCKTPQERKSLLSTSLTISIHWNYGENRVCCVRV